MHRPHCKSGWWQQQCSAYNEDALCVQAKMAIRDEADAEGKSEERGIYFAKRDATWRVATQPMHGNASRVFADASTREDAEAIIKAYTPRLRDAAVGGSFETELATVKEELKVRVPL